MLPDADAVIQGRLPEGFKCTGINWKSDRVSCASYDKDPAAGPGQGLTVSEKSSR